jgi:hypothetical protein
MTINGFAVVRLPNLNYLVPERDVIPFANGIYYAGVDRQRWADVFDEDFYAKTAPAEIIRLASTMRYENNDFTGIDLCQDEQVALHLLTYANRKSNANELIALRSRELDAFKGTVETELHIHWIGFDFVSLGEWSLIAGGIFVCLESYSKWLDSVNRFGLFDDPSLLHEYVLAYEQSVAAEQSEPLAPPSADFARIAIEVGVVSTASN